METVWIVVGAILMLTGIVGCLLPVLPGPPLSFLALLFLQIGDNPAFSLRLILVWAGITLAVTVFDYFIPMLGAKRYGGSKKGIWGAGLGALAGIFFFPPFGLIVGPFAGAFLGEVLSNNKKSALKSALGTFLGFMMGVVIKLAACMTMAFYFVSAIVQ
jgi:uncharacterized protein YqgC (DUF456 family)